MLSCEGEMNKEGAQWSEQYAELVEAVQHGDIDRVREFLELGLDPNYSEDDDGWSLLHWASQEGHTDIIKLLVENGADVDAKFLRNITPLFNATGEGNLSVVTTLLQLGADVNSNGRNGTALHNAVVYGYKEIAKLLIVSGADVNAVDGLEGRTPIFEGAARGHTDLVQLVLAHGAKKDVRDNDGKLPIDEAKANKRKDIISLLS